MLIEAKCLRYQISPGPVVIGICEVSNTGEFLFLLVFNSFHIPNINSVRGPSV